MFLMLICVSISIYKALLKIVKKKNIFSAEKYYVIIHVDEYLRITSVQLWLFPEIYNLQFVFKQIRMHILPSLKFVVT